jgi:hypothetical protein
MINLNMCDATLTGRVLQQFFLPIPSEQVTVRALITERVRYEVAQHNQNRTLQRYTLITPTETEATLNGYADQTRPMIDAEAACARALTAFERNRFVLLVDDRQVTELDQVVTVSEHSVIQFVKLVPLVGG